MRVSVYVFSLSVSTLSISSGSSRGSLASLTSSKGSLGSLNFADIYNQSSLPDVDLPDLHRRVEKLLQGASVCGGESGGSNQYLATIIENPQTGGGYSQSPHSSHNSLTASGSDITPPPPPTYEQHVDKQLRAAKRFSRSQPNVYQATAAAAHAQSASSLSYSHPNLPQADPTVMQAPQADMYPVRPTQPNDFNQAVDHMLVPRFAAMSTTHAVATHMGTNAVGSTSDRLETAQASGEQLLTQLAGIQAQVSPPPYPGAKPRDQNIAEPLMPQRPAPSLSPLSKSSSAHSAVIARSVSGGVSNESLAGDSGVFEAAGKRLV